MQGAVPSGLGATLKSLLGLTAYCRSGKLWPPQYESLVGNALECSCAAVAKNVDVKTTRVSTCLVAQIDLFPNDAKEKEKKE